MNKLAIGRVGPMCRGIGVVPDHAVYVFKCVVLWDDYCCVLDRLLW